MFCLSDNQGNLGFVASFITLLLNAEGSYFMYCDQDDYWLPNKISTMLGVIEKKNNTIPQCVFCDGWVTDSKLKIRGNKRMYSFFKYDFNKAISNYEYNLTHDFIYLGCSMLFNRACKKFIFPNNRNDLSHETMKYFCHDSIVGLCCTAKGECTFVKDKLMYYRQSINTFGFDDINKNHNLLFYFNKLLVHFDMIIHRNYTCYVSLPFKVNYIKIAILRLYVTLMSTKDYVPKKIVLILIISNLQQFVDILIQTKTLKIC